ncbi:MAG: MarR family winged helix-turn-helix transcriptional regulator [Kiloniellales bacterium]
MPREDALKAAHLIERLERLARGQEATDRLNPAQWQALRYLASTNRFSRTPAALADFLASTRGTVSRTIAALEANGYVTRRSNREDRRGVVLALTAKAEKALEDDPLLDLARDVEEALGGDSARLAQSLSAVLMRAVSRNERRPFGICLQCRHFRRNAHPSAVMPHHCALLDEQLSEIDGHSICVEQEAAA